MRAGRIIMLTTVNLINFKVNDYELYLYFTQE